MVPHGRDRRAHGWSRRRRAKRDAAHARVAVVCVRRGRAVGRWGRRRRVDRLGHRRTEVEAVRRSRGAERGDDLRARKCCVVVVAVGDDDTGDDQEHRDAGDRDRSRPASVTRRARPRRPRRPFLTSARRRGCHRRRVLRHPSALQTDATGARFPRFEPARHSISRPRPRRPRSGRPRRCWRRSCRRRRRCGRGVVREHEAADVRRARAISTACSTVPWPYTSARACSARHERRAPHEQVDARRELEDRVVVGVERVGHVRERRVRRT